MILTEAYRNPVPLHYRNPLTVTFPILRKAHKSNFGHGGGGEHKKPKKKSRATVVDKDKE